MNRTQQKRLFEYEIADAMDRQTITKKRVTHAERRRYRQAKLKRLFGDDKLTKKGIRNGLPTEVIHHILGFVPSISQMWAHERRMQVRRILRSNIRSRVNRRFPMSRTPWSESVRRNSYVRWLEHIDQIRCIKQETHNIQKEIKSLKMQSIHRRLENKKSQDKRKKREYIRKTRRFNRSLTKMRLRNAINKMKNLEIL